jgi:hypothetical protein
VVEHFIGNEEVLSSILSGSTSKTPGFIEYSSGHETQPHFSINAVACGACPLPSSKWPQSRYRRDNRPTAAPARFDAPESLKPLTFGSAISVLRAGGAAAQLIQGAAESYDKGAPFGGSRRQQIQFQLRTGGLDGRSFLSRCRGRVMAAILIVEDETQVRVLSES